VAPRGAICEGSSRADAAARAATSARRRTVMPGCAEW
jgi:hypothetical protein